MLMAHRRKFKFYYTAMKGTRYARESALHPVIDARDIGSAIKKFNRMPFRRKTDIFKIEEVV